MLVVLRFTVAPQEDVAALTAEAARALTALAARPGYLRGHFARAYDDPQEWCLVTQWSSVGDYRRALGAYDVKVQATPLLSRAVPVASAFEVLATAEPGAAATAIESDRAVEHGSAVESNPAEPTQIRSGP